MKRKTNYIIIILMLFVVNTQAQTELNNYLQIGAENNPGLKAKYSAYNAALEKVPQVGTLPNLNVSFGYFISPIETRIGPQQAKISVSQMFPWFGTLGSNKDVYTERAKANYELFEESKSKLFFDIKSTYYDLYFIQKGINITKENIAILSTFKQLALIKIGLGKSSVVDELRIEMEINDLESKLAYLKDSKWTLEVKFHQLINDSSIVAINTPEQLWDEKLPLNKNELLDSIMSNNHLIKEIEHKIFAWKNEEIASNKKGGPQIILGLDYAFIGKSDNPNLGSSNGKDAIMPMVGISIPLYRKKYKAMINEAAINIEVNQFQKNNKQNELTILFEKTFRDFSDADRRIELNKKQLKLANKSLNILLTSYSTNGKNFEEVLRMERKVLAYALALDKARADKSATIAFINYLTGK